MDDPWGSPWANNDDPNPSSTSLTLEPPPRVLLSAKISSSNNNSLSAPSLWANNEDGFGDWAGGDGATTPNSSLNPWASWGDSNQQPNPRRDSPKKEFLAAWPAATSTASSPSIRPLPQSHVPSGSTPTLSRQPSFDPWESNLSLRTPGEDTSVRDIQVDLGYQTRSDRISLDSSKIELSSKDDDQSRKEPEHEPLTTTKARSDQTPHVSTGGNSAKPDTNRQRSRSSSRSSSNSTREDCARDSPITSVDEDARELPDQREASTKVRELVDLFDGLAKKDETTKQPQVNDSRKGDSQESQGSEEDDFGDFKDATDGGKDEAELVQSSSVQSPAKSSTGQWSEARGDSPLASPGRDRAMSIKVEVEIPLDLIDKLFPPPKESGEAVKGHNRAESFEHIVYDTFSEISERRTWYRISRFGSMLRNDAPDFENYTSVSWPNTKVHDETLTTVRSWMEGEMLGSSGTGRNGTRNGGGFGWDSSAPTVSMEEIFGRKKRPTHISTASESWIQRPSTVPLRSPIGTSAKPPTSPPNTATFGWSTSSAEPPPASPKRPLSFQQQPRDILHQKQASNPWTVAAEPPSTISSNTKTSFRWGSLDGLESKKEAAVPVKDKPLERSHTGPAHVGGDQQHINTWEPSPVASKNDGRFGDSNDDDDEWGEMVSSPAVDAPPFQLPAGRKPISKSTPSTSAVPLRISMEVVTAEDEEAVEKIVNQLPDLSWMLQ